MSATKQERSVVPASQGGTSPRMPERQELKLDRVLVPLDFSGESRQALDFAVPLAEKYGGKIFLIHAVEPVPAYAPYPEQLGFASVNPRLVGEASQERLSVLARELVPPEVLARTIVRTGRAYREIIRAADELETGLIVMATHGYTGLKHVLLGSTAEHVVREAPCPVLTVRRNAHGLGAGTRAKADPSEKQSRPPDLMPRRFLWRRILVPIDFSKTSFRALGVAVPLARDLGARLFLLSAVEPGVYAAGLESVALAVPDATLFEDAKASLPKIANRLIPSDVKVTAVVERGRAHEVITRVAREERIDLIVLTTHGRTGIEHFMMGSTAEHVVRHARCAVYIVRSLGRNRNRRREEN